MNIGMRILAAAVLSAAISFPASAIGGPGVPPPPGAPKTPGSAGTPRSGSERAGVWPDRTVCRFGEPGWKNV